MSAHEIYGKYISITIADKKKYQYYRTRVYLDNQPASLAYFTIGNLQTILARLVNEPYQKIHHFSFGKKLFRVEVYDPESETPLPPRRKKAIPKIPS